MLATSPRPLAVPTGSLHVVPFPHPQGCRTWLLVDPDSRQALALDVHLDLVDALAVRVEEEGWTLPYVVDTHTHADHASGAADLAARFRSTRIAHAAGHHRGVARHPADGETLHLGDRVVRVLHAPGHTPDHVVLATDGALFTGDTLLLGSVARTDFLGGDAGQLFDSLERVLRGLPDATVVHPGHDYTGRLTATLGEERRSNPWLRMRDRAAFIAALTANPPPRPANMDDLLAFNKDGRPLPDRLSAAEAVQRVAAGAAASLLDVRTGAEVAAEGVAGAHVVPLDDLAGRLDEVRALPAPRLLLCRTGRRADLAREVLTRLGVRGLCVIDGGLEAWKQAGGPVVKGRGVISLERQVRIAAGALALLGAVLALVVHPVFAGLSAFIGAGLVFAGVTDWCGMGLLLARMPWNRSRPGPGAGAGAAGCSAGGCSASPPPA